VVLDASRGYPPPILIFSPSHRLRGAPLTPADRLHGAPLAPPTLPSPSHRLPTPATAADPWNSTHRGILLRAVNPSQHDDPSHTANRLTPRPLYRVDAVHRYSPTAAHLYMPPTPARRLRSPPPLHTNALPIAVPTALAPTPPHQRAAHPCPDCARAHPSTPPRRPSLPRQCTPPPLHTKTLPIAAPPVLATTPPHQDAADGCPARKRPHRSTPTRRPSLPSQ